MQRPMDPDLNEALVLADWARAQQTAHDLGMRLIRRDGVNLYFAMTGQGGVARTFVLDCDGYPEQAPHVAFVDPQTFRPTGERSVQCVSGTRSYYHLHPERLAHDSVQDEWRIWRTLETVFAVVKAAPRARRRYK